MKKIFYSFTAGLVLVGLALVGMLSGCEDVNEQFNSLDSLTQVTNKSTYNYTMVDADYLAVSKLVQKPITDLITPKNTVITAKKSVITAKNTEIDAQRLALVTAANHADSAVILANIATLNSDIAILNGDIATINSEIATLKLDPTYVMGGSVNTYKYLPKDVVDSTWVDSWLNTTFKYGDIDSKTLLTYNAEYDTLVPIAIPSIDKYTLKATDYTAMKVTSLTGGAFFDSKYTPAYFVPIWLKQSFPYANPGDRKLIRYSYNTGTFAAQVISKRWMVSVYDGTNWTKYGFVTPQTLQYAFTANGWKPDPTITVALVKGSPNNLYVMAFINYLIAHKDDAVNPTKWYPKNTYVNEEHYYGFSAYYPEIINTGDRILYGDPVIKALTTDEARWALYRVRVAEAMPLFTQVNFPLLKKDVNGIQQYVIWTIPSYYSSSKIGMYTIKMKCTVSGTDTAPAVYEVESCVETF